MDCDCEWYISDPMEWVEVLRPMSVFNWGSELQGVSLATCLPVAHL